MSSVGIFVFFIVDFMSFYTSCSIQSVQSFNLGVGHVAQDKKDTYTKGREAGESDVPMIQVSGSTLVNKVTFELLFKLCNQIYKLTYYF